MCLTTDYMLQKKQITKYVSKAVENVQTEGHRNNGWYVSQIYQGSYNMIKHTFIWSVRKKEMARGEKNISQNFP